MLLASASAALAAAFTSIRSDGDHLMRGAICNRCHKTSLGCGMRSSRSICRRRVRSDCGAVRETFSRTSAQRMRTSGFASRSPAASSRTSERSASTSRTTSSERPFDRRSPPSSLRRSGCTGAGQERASAWWKGSHAAPARRPTGPPARSPVRRVVVQDDPFVQALVLRVRATRPPQRERPSASVRVVLALRSGTRVSSRYSERRKSRIACLSRLPSASKLSITVFASDGP